ncbi:hypothetical protein VP01_3749g2 [Puccinia sorghi]|uniref:Uncharacterized protein n=1 Tax=Puccinia sorghi TaxID=27349 RepID=A0A0L6UU02_9BASI|nr:hypothetical protein VP01_3749g2 [Puccinia sorghi]
MHHISTPSWDVGFSHDDHSACLSSRLITLRMVLNFQCENSTLPKTQETRASSSGAYVTCITIKNNWSGKADIIGRRQGDDILQAISCKKESFRVLSDIKNTEKDKEEHLCIPKVASSFFFNSVILCYWVETVRSLLEFKLHKLGWAGLQSMGGIGPGSWLVVMDRPDVGGEPGGAGGGRLGLAPQHEDSWMMGRARRSCPVREGSSNKLSHHAFLGLRVDVSTLAETAPFPHPVMVGKGEGKIVRDWRERLDGLWRKERGSGKWEVGSWRWRVEGGKWEVAGGRKMISVADTSVLIYQSFWWQTARFPLFRSKSWDGTVGYNKGSAVAILPAVDSMEIPPRSFVSLVIGRPRCLHRVAQQFKLEPCGETVECSVLRLALFNPKIEFLCRSGMFHEKDRFISPLCCCSLVLLRRTGICWTGPSSRTDSSFPSLATRRQNAPWLVYFLFTPCWHPGCLNPSLSENKLPDCFDQAGREDRDLHYQQVDAWPRPQRTEHIQLHRPAQVTCRKFRFRTRSFAEDAESLSSAAPQFSQSYICETLKRICVL